MADSFREGRKELPSMRAHTRGSMPKLPQPTIDWVNDRAHRDLLVAKCPKNLWLVHGNLYDLSKYMDSHPGGREWLELSRGTDCSVEFETHHLNEAKVNSVLKKYYVRPCPEATKVAAYSFEERGFYKTLKRAVFQELRETGWGPTVEMKVLCALAVALWAVAFVNMCISKTLSSALIAGLFQYPLFGVGHNFFHQRNSLWRFVFDVSCFGSHDWRISHAISHHHFPNLDNDIEVSFVEPWLRFLRNQKPNLPGVLVIWMLFNVIMAPLEFTRRALYLLTRREVLRPEMIIPVTLASTCLWVCGTWGLVLFFITHFVANTLLVGVSTPVHRSEFAWTVGCEAVVPSAHDFGEHTLLATNDFLAEEAGLFSKLFLFSSFNDHITHHLFPTICLSQQHRVRQLVLDHCRKFGIPYRKTRFFEMFCSVFAVLRRNPGELLYSPAIG